MSLPPLNGKSRTIKGGPVFDLAALQLAIRQGQINEDSVVVVNKSCDEGLDTLSWNLQDILDCLQCARSSDYKGSEWCETTWAGNLPCDAYAIPYDDQNQQRTRGPLKYYLKFSLEQGGNLKIQMVRTHLSR